MSDDDSHDEDECLADAKVRLRKAVLQQTVQQEVSDLDSSTDEAARAASDNIDNNKVSEEAKEADSPLHDHDEDIFVDGDEPPIQREHKRRRLRKARSAVIEEESSDGESSGRSDSEDEEEDSSDAEDPSDSSAEEEQDEEGDVPAGHAPKQKTLAMKKPYLEPTRNARAGARTAQCADRWARTGVGAAKSAREYEEEEARRLTKREKQQVRTAAPLLQETLAVGAVWTACAAPPRPAWSRSLQSAAKIAEEDKANHVSMAAVESRHGLSKHNTTARDEETHLAAARSAAKVAEEARASAEAAGKEALDRSNHSSVAPKPQTAPRPHDERRSNDSGHTAGDAAAASDGWTGAATSTPPSAFESHAATWRNRRAQPAPLRSDGLSEKPSGLGGSGGPFSTGSSGGSGGSGGTRPMLSSMMRSRLPRVSRNGSLHTAMRLPSSLRDSTGSAGLQALAKGNSWSFVSTSRTASTSNLRSNSGARQVAAAASGALPKKM